MYLLGLIVPVFSFCLQVWPRLINRYFGVDTWRFLIFANYVRRYKKFPKEIRGKYMVVGPFCYPPVIIKILSFFPKSFNEKYQFIFSPAFDFLHNYFIFVVSMLLFNNPLAAILAQVVAALTPVVVIEASQLNTRALSYLIFSLSFFPLIMFSHTHLIFWLVLAFIWLMVLFYTHRFALQAYLFCVIGLSLIERNPLYLAFFLVAFAVVYILGGKFYKAVFDEHMAHLIFWRKNINFRYAHQIRGNVKPKKVVKDFIYKMYNLSFKNPFVYILGNNPWLGIYLLGFFIGMVFNGQIALKLNIWVLALLATSFLTLFVKSLRFLGEGHRYLEYAVLPVSVLLGRYFSFLYGQFGTIPFVIFAAFCTFVFISIVFLQRKTIVLDRARTIGKELWEIINYLNVNVGKKVRLASFPNGLGDSMIYFLKGQVLTTDSITERMRLGMWPVLKEPFDNLIVRFKLNYVLIDETYVGVDELKIKSKKIVKDINNYILLKVQ